MAMAIDLLAEVLRGERPADSVVSHFLRTRRFIGAKDRPAIVDPVWRVLRRRARLGWHLARAGAEATPRHLVIADLVVGEAMHPNALASWFDGQGHGADRLKQSERDLAAYLHGRALEPEDMPAVVAAEIPGWAADPLRAALGPGWIEEMRAHREPAAVDLRVNVAQMKRKKVVERLAEDGIVAEPTPYAPHGLRLAERVAIQNHALFRSGAIEIQDEGSQLVAELVAALPGEQICDFCAGAGGKALALAATMAGKGRVVACDVLDKRLARAKERIKRTNQHNIETRALSSESDKWVKRNRAKFDAVLVDAPCTGTGTWRRNPDARWNRLGPDLDELHDLQRRILASAARLVRPGGRLIYATCSLLPSENEEQIAHFLADHPEFSTRPAGVVLGRDDMVAGDFLRTWPGRHGTDGFFAALLHRHKP